MADDKKSPETPVAPAPAQDAVKNAPDRKVTDNPGEGSLMFSDWALI